MLEETNPYRHLYDQSANRGKGVANGRASRPTWGTGLRASSRADTDGMIFASGRQGMGRSVLTAPVSVGVGMRLLMTRALALATVTVVAVTLAGCTSAKSSGQPKHPGATHPTRPTHKTRPKQHCGASGCAMVRVSRS